VKNLRALTVISLPTLKNKFSAVIKVACLMAPLLSAATASAMPPHHKRTIDAIEKCLGTTKAAIEAGSKKSPSIRCSIPFSFQEQELDAVITASGSAEKPLEETPEERANRKRLNSASKTTVKTLINVREAKCQASVNVKTSLIEKAIAMKSGSLTFPAQPVKCDLTTKGNKTQKVSFTFKPTGTFEGNCLKEFSPEMGNFNIECTFCRLNFVAKTMSYWVNRLGARFRPGINRAIGKPCRN
jgi:hypothetical protein